MHAAPARSNFLFGPSVNTAQSNFGGPLMTALMAGRVSPAIDTLMDPIELQRVGKIRILASAGARRTTLWPEVPTLTEFELERSGGTRADRAALLKRDSEQWAPIIKLLGFKAD